jgi:hypothetical protein
MVASLILASVGCDRSHDRAVALGLDAERVGPSGPSSPAPPAGGITAEEDAGIPAGPPGRVLVSHHPGSLHRIEWQGTLDDTIRGYQIYRRCPNGEWEEIAYLPLHDDDERNRAVYLFEDRFDVVCDYTVAAVDHLGNAGPKSADIQ